ncbi:MAG: hypothetical protein P1U78_08555 [Alcanivoracaceae bacterium]|nr:hypothetical protein [Alcanivoracaceae bacterium]
MNLLRKTLLLTIALLFSSQATAALQCEAGPGDEGDAQEAGTPGPLRFYQPTGSVGAGSTSISLTTTVGLAAGDMVLIIQMQGAGINSANTDSYGDGVAGGDASGWLNDSNFTAGRYEYAGVASVGGGTITLNSPLINGYVRANASGTIGQSRYQVIRVPQYDNLTLTGNISAPAWNGETGGVLPLDVANTLDFNGFSINMNATGFRGGGGFLHSGRGGASNTDFRNTSSNTATGAHGSKGEGIAGTPRYVYPGSGTRIDTGVEGYPNGSYARGAPGNAGGGGTDGRPSNNDENSGGGGGSNGGAGARGGNSWNSNLPVGGYGGTAFPALPNRLVMGGGGGAATGNNGNSPPPHGGVGGGIVLIRANDLADNGVINVNGSDGTTPNPVNDGGGGGGAGGSALVLANSQTGTLTINAEGGNGGNADPGGVAHGPGGGGGGGVVFINDSFSAIINTTQGASGYTITPGNYFGATPAGGDVGSGVEDTNPDDIDGVSPGSDCAVRSDLAISKTRSSGLLLASQPAQFRIQVSNNGPDATLNSIEVVDVLDSRFSYTGFTGTGWSCSESPAQTISCSHAGPLANGASLPDLFIDVDVGAVGSGSQSVDNTATVTLATGNGNVDGDSGNNSSTLTDTIYGASVSGNKRLYAYPDTATTGTLQRIVPTTDINATPPINRNNLMNLDLSPALSDDLVISGDMAVHLCVRKSGTRTDQARTVGVTVRRSDTNAIIGATPATQNLTGTGWQWLIFTVNHTGPTTIPSGAGLRLQVDMASGHNLRTLDFTSNGGGTLCTSPDNLPSRVEVDASTVINVDSVDIYDDASPAGSLITRMVESATVYVRSTVTDPFGFADINNDSTVDVLDSGGIPVSGPHAQTSVLSQSGNTKVFEYEVPLPADWQDGPFTLRVRANEGTEGTVTHYNAASIELTDPPLLAVSKLASTASASLFSSGSASPGEDIDYQVLVSNTHVLGTGDAVGVVVTDQLPQFTNFLVGSIQFIDEPAPYISSNLNVDVIEYSEDGGLSWLYTPVSEGGGAPPGYDANVTHFRVLFDGVMPPNGGFRLEYSLQLQ